MQALSTLIIDRFEGDFAICEREDCTMVTIEKKPATQRRSARQYFKNRERWNDSPGCRGRASPQGDDFQDAGEPI